MSLNMKKEIRKELRELKKKINADHRALDGDISVQLKIKILAEREIARLEKIRKRQWTKTNRRILVLQGRLS
jgi:hypothetical protein